MCMFKLAMEAQASKAMADPFDSYQLTKLWVRISKSDLFTQRLSAYLKLTKIVIVSMLRSIEDECVFFHTYIHER
jgi:hypothetical protein